MPFERAELNLLLLLTALFASLTGAGAGDRGMQQVHGVAVVRAAEVAQASVQRAQAALPAAAMPARIVASAPAWAPFAASSLPGAHLPFERWLE